jgi:hypothetical protein
MRLAKFLAEVGPFTPFGEWKRAEIRMKIGVLLTDKISIGGFGGF